MNPPATQTPALPLDPATLAALLRTTVDAMPHHPNASEAEQTTLRQAAFAAIAALRPRDPLEAMLAARVVAAHFHAIHAFRCAARTDLPPNLHLRYEGKALALSRLTAAASRELTRRQAGPALHPAALPAPVPAPRARPAPAAATADTPKPLAPAPGETPHAAAPGARDPRPEALAAASRSGDAAATRPVVPAQVSAEDELHQRILVGITARAATSLTCLAALAA